MKIIYEVLIYLLIGIMVIMSASLIYLNTPSIINVLSLMATGILVLLVVLHRKSTNDFFKMHKWGIILSILIANLLDTSSTYYLMTKAGNIQNEVNAFAKIVVYLFGINYFSMFILFITGSILMVYLIKILEAKLAKPFYFVFVSLKVLVSIMNML